MKKIALIRSNAQESEFVLNALQDLPAHIVDIFDDELIEIQLIDSAGGLMITLGGDNIDTFDKIIYLNSPNRVCNSFLDNDDNNYIFEEKKAALIAGLYLRRKTIVNRHRFLTFSGALLDQPTQLKILKNIGWQIPEIKISYKAECDFLESKIRYPDPEANSSFLLTLSSKRYFCAPYGKLSFSNSFEINNLILHTQKYMMNMGIGWATIPIFHDASSFYAYGFSNELSINIGQQYISRILRDCIS